MNGYLTHIKKRNDVKRLEQEEAYRSERERIEGEKRIAKEKAAKRLKKTVAIVAPILLACIAFVIILIKVIIPNQKYSTALELVDSGKYKQATTAFAELNGYKDSDAMIEKIKPLYQKELLSEASVGSTVFFGNYEQDNNKENGKEPVEWLVLDKKDDTILIVSRYALDCQRYNKTYTSIQWESCSLRTWLNEYFLNNAFTEDEQTIIRNTTVRAQQNPRYGTSSGHDTNDKVFLLSIQEAKEYFSTRGSLICQGTAYCYAQGAHKNDDGTCWWWLRSPGQSDKYAAYVRNLGSINQEGHTVAGINDAVRPALWIDFGS